MRPRAPILAIFRKELIEMLRDRRTLIASVLIPVVLYPVLLVGFLRAAESEMTRLKEQCFVIEVPDESARKHLEDIIRETRERFEDSAELPATFHIRIGTTLPTHLGDEVQLLVTLTDTPQPPPMPSRLHITVQYKEVNIRSLTAMQQLNAVLERYRQELARRNLGNILEARGAGEWDVDLILDPVEIEATSTATERERGGWALGQVIPLILVMMIVTGTIYPAIDLTAGERERGTLETLMTAPIPILHLIMGKFLVVATIGMITALLNVASVGATIYFGGVAQLITEQMTVASPFGSLPIILACMVPFALLFAGVMLAVCSFARTFKEAQNYVMPVIIIALIPAFAAVLPTVRLEGALLVLPVGNMVLLTRELLQGTYTWTMITVVVLSTTLYAAAAVAAATRLFGQEAVLFADAASYRTMLQRRFFKPTPRPSPAQALLLIALLFPMSFYAQSLLAGASNDNLVNTLGWLAIIQFAGLFVALPVGLAVFLKIDVVETFQLRLPPARSWLAAALLGLSAWVLASEFLWLQGLFLPPSELTEQVFEQMDEQLRNAPLALALLLIAVTPGVAEEMLFRGFVLSGLRDSARKWSAILAVSVIFGVYHFTVDKIPLTALLGVLLAYICWQSRSIFPGMLFHVLHNGLAVVLPEFEKLRPWIEPPTEGPMREHLPVRTLVAATICFIIGLTLLASIRRPARGSAAETVGNHED